MVGIVCTLVAGLPLGASVAWSAQHARLEAIQDDLGWTIDELESELEDVSDQLSGCQTAVGGAAGALVPAWHVLAGVTDSVETFSSPWDYRAGDAFLLSAGVFDGRTAVSAALDDATTALLTCDLTEH